VRSLRLIFSARVIALAPCQSMRRRIFSPTHASMQISKRSYARHTTGCQCFGCISHANSPQDNMTAHPTDNPWHQPIHDRFRGSPYPLLIAEGRITPAASLWTGSRLWVQAFRESGLTAGDRIVLALPPSAAFVQVLLACLWEGLAVGFAPPSPDLSALLEELDARIGVSTFAGTHLFNPADSSNPPADLPALRDAVHAPSPDVRFLLRTSGTSGASKWVALSDANLFATLNSHQSLLDLEGARTLSILPWHHAFGLIIDLMCSLMSGSEIVRDDSDGRSGSRIIEQMRSGETTHLCAVPLQVARILESEGGRECLRTLQGGVIGGAPVSAELARFLAETQLRAGYGQTEASPGIALGLPGEWQAGYMGRQVGCSVRLDEESVLHFSGQNACLGYWTSDGLHTLEPSRWVNTGDVARQEAGRLIFGGRSDDTFKLSNGRAILAGRWEALLKEGVPEIEEALLHSPDGCNLELCVSTGHGEPAPLSKIHRVFGDLGARLTLVQMVAPEEWVRTPKGSIDRRTMTRRMAA